jgi:Fur family ferric uptake transcriptional regulator
MPSRDLDRPAPPRATRQRAAIASALGAAGGFRSAQALHEHLRAAGDRVGLTTVYRTLQALADSGEVDVLRTADGEALYRRCASAAHHHHLVCRRCGRAVEVEGPDIEAWATATARRYRFTDVNHVAEIFGTCADCRAA